MRLNKPPVNVFDKRIISAAIGKRLWRIVKNQRKWCTVKNLAGRHN